MLGSDQPVRARPKGHAAPSDAILVTRQWPGRLVAVLAAWLGVTCLVATTPGLTSSTAAAIMIAISGGVGAEWLSWRYRTLTLTTAALSARTGFLPSEVCIPVRHISGIGRDQSMSGVFWGYGRLRIWHAGGVLELDLIPDVAAVADRLAGLISADEDRRSRSQSPYP